MEQLSKNSEQEAERVPSFTVGLQTDTVTMKICVANSQKAKSKSTI